MEFRILFHEMRYADHLEGISLAKPVLAAVIEAKSYDHAKRRFYEELEGSYPGWNRIISIEQVNNG